METKSYTDFANELRSKPESMHWREECYLEEYNKYRQRNGLDPVTFFDIEKDPALNQSTTSTIIGTKQNHTETTESQTVITDVCIPFGRMVAIILKWMLASIPAIFLMYVIIFFFILLFGAGLGGCSALLL